MMLYVRNPDAYEFDPRFEFGSEGVVVELGAGTGAAGLAFAGVHPHARVVLTDLPEVCPLLQANARGYGGVEVRPLSWGCAADAQALQAEPGLAPISCVICSDLVCGFKGPFPSPLVLSVIGVLSRAACTAAPHAAASHCYSSSSTTTTTDSDLVQDSLVDQRNGFLVRVWALVHV